MMHHFIKGNARPTCSASKILELRYPEVQVITWRGRCIGCTVTHKYLRVGRWRR